MWRNCEEGQAVQKIERKIKLSGSACRCNKKDDAVVSEFDNECVNNMVPFAAGARLFQ